MQGEAVHPHLMVMPETIEVLNGTTARHATSHTRLQNRALEIASVASQLSWNC